ncbi:Antirestriction protein (ArdA) [Desulfocapsa sulfexigens DSM 10523]|uniref:Antirestriction protein (ArdA) n=1 Tax=Desulfocapsa sulfexigens (strain DSM 10523 / SB164P1) TaxID=1167006 RepID=M1NBR2_DESSD|nr:antirestriction protein ArdA [Desulfocapsa sulfexigens]AGF77249.1 Antirestriction protein (ArdA) [Desulfocapsa sulfexigens DSM 10523]
MEIYVTNLSQYNAGKLVGEWLELPCSEEELQDALSRVLDPDKEYFITDTEGLPFTVNEYDNIYRVNEKLEQYVALEATEALCVTFLLSEGYDWNYSIEHHEDVIVYAEQNLEDVAYSLVEDGCFGAIGTSLENYIDYSAIARDLSYDGYREREEGVFYYVG